MRASKDLEFSQLSLIESRPLTLLKWFHLTLFSCYYLVLLLGGGYVIFTYPRQQCSDRFNPAVNHAGCWPGQAAVCGLASPTSQVHVKEGKRQNGHPLYCKNIKGLKGG